MRESNPSYIFRNYIDISFIIIILCTSAPYVIKLRNYETDGALVYRNIIVRLKDTNRYLRKSDCSKHIIYKRCGDFTIEQKLKQRICIEFCVKLQISATETFEMLNKVFPNDSPKRTTVFEWHSRFKAGRISIEDEPRQGRPKCAKITDLIKENPRTTFLELEQDTGISKTTIGRIVTKDLKLKKTPAKFIPRFLTNEQKLCRLATCENMLEMTRTDPEWKDKIITGDETWVYDYDPETKRHYAEWRGQGQTVIKEMYLDILRHQGKRFEKKCQKNGLMVTGSYTITMPALTQRTW
ncbi:hypothetical protein LAZ67_1000223 [Cordylochernes scorpioides]|uniref:Mos1 transposase HTH domain-containing protein n=1 Tax=Cordylochernes scorpioides TaxID=51811 RepID=A0ABY6JUM3_9ARAC|nr:hypothetical protein LAZ67_1000223 [Cordylochernes scorpioides]